jgi:hypothetical protein
MPWSTALSVGTVNSADLEQLASLHAVVRAEVDTAERMVRMKDADVPAVDAAGRPIAVAGQMTGFLLRSKLVSGWPGMHVRAYSTDTRPDDKTIPDMDTSPDRVRILRMERLAPAVLLVLFDGVPAVVHLEEPRSGIQFGVRMSFTNTTGTAVLPLRDVAHPNAGFLKTPTNQDRSVDVPFRRGAPGVINIAELSTRLINATGTGIGGTTFPPSSPWSCCASCSARSSATRRSTPVTTISSPRSAPPPWPFGIQLAVKVIGASREQPVERRPAEGGIERPLVALSQLGAASP